MNAAGRLFADHRQLPGQGNQYGTHERSVTQPGFRWHVGKGVFALELDEDPLLSTTALVHQYRFGKGVTAVGDHDLEIKAITERLEQVQLEQFFSLFCIELAYEQETSTPVLTPGLRLPALLESVTHRVDGLPLDTSFNHFFQ